MAGANDPRGKKNRAKKQTKKADAKEGVLVRYLRRTGTRKGFMGDSKPWLYIGAASYAVRLLRRLAHKKPDVLLLEELKPGQRIIISNSRPTVDVG